MRMIVADDAMAPTERIRATDIFVCLFICKFLTKNIGKSANVQSVRHAIAEYPMKKLVGIEASIQYPTPGTGAKRVQKYDEGEH